MESTSCFFSAALIIRIALSRASSLAFMAATMSACTRSSNAIDAAILDNSLGGCTEVTFIAPR